MDSTSAGQSSTSASPCSQAAAASVCTRACPAVDKCQCAASTVLSGCCPASGADSSASIIAPINLRPLFMVGILLHARPQAEKHISNKNLTDLCLEKTEHTDHRRHHRQDLLR